MVVVLSGCKDYILYTEDYVGGYEDFDCSFLLFQV